MSGNDNYDELPVKGWTRIAAILGCEVRTAQRRRKTMIDDNVLFTRFEGRPRHKIVFSYPSLLKAWVMTRTRVGQPL